MTEDPGAVTATSPVGAGIGNLLVAVGNGCLWAITAAFRVSVLKKSLALIRGSVLEKSLALFRVSVLKKSLALRPGTAALTFCCLGRKRLLQLKEQDKLKTSKKSEIFRSFFIVHILVYFGKTTEKIVLKILNPLLCCPLSLGTTFVDFKCYIGTYFI